MQPLDVSIKKPCKTLMKEELNYWMQPEDSSTTPTGQRKRLIFTQVCMQMKDLGGGNKE